MKLLRFVQGIRMVCPACGPSKAGMLVIGNDDNTGHTVSIKVVCPDCKTELMSWPNDIHREGLQTVQAVLNGNINPSEG